MTEGSVLHRCPVADNFFRLFSASETPTRLCSLSQAHLNNPITRWSIVGTVGAQAPEGVAFSFFSFFPICTSNAPICIRHWICTCPLMNCSSFCQFRKIIILKSTDAAQPVCALAIRMVSSKIDQMPIEMSSQANGRFQFAKRHFRNDFRRSIVPRG